MIDAAPVPPESKFALEGTDGHTCFETFAKNGPHKMLQTEAFLRGKFPLNMVTTIGALYRDLVFRFPKNAEVLSETRSDLSFIHPNFYGTADLSIVDEFVMLEVIDLKYGKGKIVEAEIDGEFNPQLAAYALGIANKYDFNFDLVRLTIAQPRAEHPKGRIRSITKGIDDLEKWVGIFRDGIARCLEPSAPLHAHREHCFFCPAKNICPEYPNVAVREAQNDFDEIEFDEFDDLSDDDFLT